MTSHSYQKLQGKYNEFTSNCINMKKEIETINKGQEEMKNTVEGIKSRLDEAEDWISKLDDKDPE